MFGFNRKKEIHDDKLTDNILKKELELADIPEDPTKERRELNKNVREYIDESRSFHRSEIKRSKKSEKIAWRMVGVMSVITVLSVAAVCGLTPLKQLIPYTIRVNDNSGFTDVVYPKGYGQTMEQVDDQFWLTTYVRARESYNWFAVSSMFKYVNLLSNNSVGESYKTYMLSDVSPVKVLADKMQIEVIVSPPVFINGAAQVRFTKRVLDRDGKESAEIKPTYWIALITFDYGKKITKKEDEMASPHGFQVLSYKVDQEFRTTTTVGIN